MTTKVETVGPDGKTLPMTHRDVYLGPGKKYRILFGPVTHTTASFLKYYVLADEEGNVSCLPDYQFETDGAYEYLPGGV